MNNSNFYKTISPYYFKLDDLLGVGSFGEVYKGKKFNDRKDTNYAIKQISKELINSNEKYRDFLSREIRILQKIKGDHVVKLIDVYQTPRNYYIILEYCDGQSLASRLEIEKKLHQNEACMIMSQIAQAFVSLGDLKDENDEKLIIMHRDLKPDNIMFHEGSVKVADFGLSKVIKQIIEEEHTRVGTLRYLPLQIHEKKPYGPKCDVWSAGLIFYEMLHGYVPWRISRLGDFHKIRNSVLEFSEDIKPEIRDLIEKMLQFEECDRIFWEQILSHPALKV